MTTNLPLCCTPEAFNLLAEQVKQIESSDALLHGAIAISMHQLENVEPGRIDQTLQQYVDTVRGRVRGHQPQALLAHLHQFLFEEQGFGGNEEDYYNPINSYIPAVLQTRRGLPITLSLVYKILAERLGLRAWGVGLPGHFVVGVECGGSRMMIDPFYAGRILSEEEARAQMLDTFGAEVEWSDEMLRPVSNRHWLTRMLQNLLHIFGSSSHFADIGAVLGMEMLLWPEQDRLQRDLALVLARIGLAQPASAWLGEYLKNNPDDPQRRDLKQLLDVLSA